MYPRDYSYRSENENDVRKDLIQEALDMHRYYEEKYYILIMVTYDNDERHNKLLDELEKKSRYWRDIYEKLLFEK